jgi:hypothetical protein
VLANNTILDVRVRPDASVWLPTVADIEAAVQCRHHPGKTLQGAAAASAEELDRAPDDQQQA